MMILTQMSGITRMLRRVALVALFLLRSLARSFLGLVPLAVTLGTYTVTFSYQGNPASYFAPVGGLDVALAAASAVLTLAALANHAMIYPVLARLPRRGELIAGVLAAASAVTVLMMALFVALALLQRTAEVSAADLLLILPRWLALCLLAMMLALHLSRLVSTPASRLGFSCLLLAVLIAADRQFFWQQSGLNWLVAAAGLVASPVVANVLVDLHPSPGAYLLAVGLPLAAAAALFWLAVRLFRRKDLLWTE